MKKVLTWLAIIIAVLWVVKKPDQAAALIQQAGHALTTLAASL